MAEMTEQAIDAALDGVRTSLRADGYDLVSHGMTGDRLRLEITAGAGACEDCLVPKSLMATLIASALALDPARLDLRYPNE